MNGKLIVIEGLDGSGKSTQLGLLMEKLKDKARFITFPDYQSLSGKIIGEYLKGVYSGLDELDGAYSASCFYAVDRYISYKTDWSKDYRSGKNIISARYSGSNLIYQMAKLEKEKWDDYYKWLNDLEHKKLRLPKADAVIFLDMPLEISREFLNKRYEDEGKESGEGLDLHESSLSYLEKCREAADYAAEKEGWLRIKCAKRKKPRKIEDINTELLKITEDLINGKLHSRIQRG
jgi:dTMP kinase